MSNYLLYIAVKYFDKILSFGEVIEISLGGYFLCPTLYISLEMCNLYLETCQFGQFGDLLYD
mgnify:CR=1 FL=1